MNSTYLLIVTISISFPLLFSNSKKFGFGGNLKWAWLSILGSAIPFIIWDIVFTKMGIWSFNPRYILGYSYFSLPLEEILFFLCIPFSCLFLYNNLGPYPKLLIPNRFSRIFWGLLSMGLILFTLILILKFPEKLYTISSFTLAALSILLIAVTHPKYSGQLLSGTIAQFFPFLIVNGILTGLPVVQYNNAATLGIRIGSIPMEDFLYSTSMLILPVFLFELFKKWDRPQ